MVRQRRRGRGTMHKLMQTERRKRRPLHSKPHRLPVKPQARCVQRGKPVLQNGKPRPLEHYRQSQRRRVRRYSLHRQHAKDLVMHRGRLHRRKNVRKGKPTDTGARAHIRRTAHQKANTHRWNERNKARSGVASADGTCTGASGQGCIVFRAAWGKAKEIKWDKLCLEAANYLVTATTLQQHIVQTHQHAQEVHAAVTPQAAAKQRTPTKVNTGSTLADKQTTKSTAKTGTAGTQTEDKDAESKGTESSKESDAGSTEARETGTDEANTARHKGRHAAPTQQRQSNARQRHAVMKHGQTVKGKTQPRDRQKT
ncbi:hypothetical protein TvY486_0006240 [Trypanosoma vivax Y486]|uniref:Uncharacterized protein n=1 Tax=Trypanosoma vivax (strain Y486) TaxID=1055687 RepID=F9WKH0_TRYVY|nr:hypothetical protein TvY486_0006240 [Trypanosoma vivax Y486]|eukprot:CCD17990.1 hypothetical protein TvY486_0006240 [Trypanosoma vivax Y486]